jgi:hypothetical protein
MTGKTTDYFLLWWIPCLMVFLCLSSCSSEKRETGKTEEQPGGSISAKTSGSAGPAESVSSSPSKETAEESGQETLSRNNPKVDKAKLHLETVNGIDRLKVVAEGSGKEGGDVSLKYEWTKNGEPAGEGDTLSGFKRGDKISVRITPFDDQGNGIASTVSTEIRNTPPRIIEHQLTNFDGKVWSYQVKATDPDGDQLTYSLKSSPEGMTINAAGLIQWNVPPGFKGSAPVTVSITDGNGGETLQSFTIDIKGEKRGP